MLKPTIKSIAIVPATDPASYTIQNASGIQWVLPITSAGYALDNRAKAKLFTERLAATKFAPGRQFTYAMAEALRSHGYSVQILENITRTTNDPDNIDYKELSYSADAVLHLYFSEIGFRSPPTSTNYLPRLNARGIVFVKNHPDYLYDETIYFGIDARPGKTWAIVADEKFAYSGFDPILENLDSVKAAFSTAIREVSMRMSGQIHAAIK